MSLPLGFLCIRTERVFLYVGRVPETMEIIAASAITPFWVRRIVITIVVITIFILILIVVVVAALVVIIAILAATHHHQQLRPLWLKC